MATEKTRNQIIDALLALAAERRYSEIGLHDIAERAGVSLASLREAFGTRIEIVAAFIERIDRAALSATSETTEESSRERVFEILMRRFDALTPYRAGVKSIVHAAQFDPLFAMGLAGIGCRSMGWMLEGADAGRTGLRGAIRANGLAVIWGRALQVWLDGDAPDLDKTMAALDRALRQGEQVVNFVERVGDCARAPMRRARETRSSTASEAGAV
jgi:AcrR family transcriptional regulator